MDLIRNVYLIYNPQLFSEGQVRSELEQEGYPHNFYITSGGNPVRVEYVIEADEFWCFGNCSTSPDYEKAMELGKEIWQMG